MGRVLGVQPACPYASDTRPPHTQRHRQRRRTRETAIRIREDKKSCWLHLQAGWRTINHTVVHGPALSSNCKKKPLFFFFFFFFLLLVLSPRCAVTGNSPVTVAHRRSSSLFFCVCVCLILFFCLRSNQPRHIQDAQREKEKLSHWFKHVYSFASHCGIHHATELAFRMFHRTGKKNVSCLSFVPHHRLEPEKMMNRENKKGKKKIIKGKSEHFELKSTTWRSREILSIWLPDVP